MVATADNNLIEVVKRMKGAIRFRHKFLSLMKTGQNEEEYERKLSEMYINLANTYLWTTCSE